MIKKKLLMLAAILICGGIVLISCSNDDDPTGQQVEYTGIPLIIYDTDIASSTDDLFAMEMLYRYEDEGPDYNFAQGIMFAKTFFRDWPQEVGMVFSPMEAG